MTTQPWDRAGEAHDALQSAVESYGPRVLSNAPMLSNLFKDLLPDSPREASLLVQAAEADIASTLREHIGQHIDPVTAVRLTATSLGERRAIDPTACMWATTEFAMILGYPVGHDPAGLAGAGAPAAVGTAAADPGDVAGWSRQAPPDPASIAGGGAPPVVPIVPLGGGLGPPSLADEVTASRLPEPGSQGRTDQYAVSGGAPGGPAWPPPPGAPQPPGGPGGAGGPGGQAWPPPPGSPPPGGPGGPGPGGPAWPPPPGASAPGSPLPPAPGAPAWQPQPQPPPPGGPGAPAEPAWPPPPGHGGPGAPGGWQPGPPAGPPTGPAGPGWPPGAPPKKKKTGLIIGIVAGALVVLLIVVLVIANSGGGGKTASPTTVTSPSTSLPPTSLTTPTTTGGLPPGIIPLAQLLPRDVDGSADCSHNSSPPTGLKGTTGALICTPKNLAGGEIFAFQFDSAADYAASLVALNKFKGFDPTTAGATCPPGTNSEDQTGWHNSTFPSRTGQILECLSVGTNNTQPDYIWTYPTQFTIIDAQGATGSSFADLDTWWTKNGPPPL